MWPSIVYSFIYRISHSILFAFCTCLLKKTITYLNTIKLFSECVNGWYGNNCSQQCVGHCRDNTACNHVTGQCEKGCTPGWTGLLCEKGTFINNSLNQKVDNVQFAFQREYWFSHLKLILFILKSVMTVRMVTTAYTTVVVIV